MLTPSDVVLNTSRVFTLGYIGWVYGGFKPATYIIYRHSQTGNIAGEAEPSPPSSSPFFIFILERQLGGGIFALAWENHSEARLKTGRGEKSGR